MIEIINENIIRNELNNTLTETSLKIGETYIGKVRDNYLLGDKRIIITTDRISAFDKVLGTIPFKGQILNQIALFWFERTKDILPNHIIEVPDPNVLIVKECKPYPIEMIIRGYLTGSAWRDYIAGNTISGIMLEQGMKNYQKFVSPLLTPSTKAEHGHHDLPISRRDIIKKGIVDAEKYISIEEAAKRLFERGTEIAAKNNLILVDTKYEFGDYQGDLTLMDEIHTPDSSRFWITDSYQERFEKGVEPEILDKEFIRQWLIDRNYVGDGTPPVLTDEIKIKLAVRYIRLYEQITGKKFKPHTGDVKERITKNLKNAGYL